jgi:archaellum component FlaC
MKYSELKEMIRRAVNEKKLTAAEKRKKEDIVKGMKKSFKGDKSAMYAIATAKAKKLAEVQGTELTSKIFDIGSTLKKVEAAIDFGMDQDPQVVQGLDQAYAELINILPIIEKDKEERSMMSENEIEEGGDHEVKMAVSSLEAIAKAIIELRQKLGNQERNIPGWIQDHIAKAENYIEQAAQGFHELKMEEKDPIDTIVAEEAPGKADMLAGKLYGLKNKIPQDVFYAIRKIINSGDYKKAEELLNRFNAPKQPTSVKADSSTFSVNEKKGKDLDGDGDVDSDDYLKARDIAIQKAKAKKA